MPVPVPPAAENPTSEIVDWSADTLSQRIHDRSVSCVEVMAAHLDQIEAVNPHVNAIVSLRPRRELLAEAAARDADLAAGRSHGWMHGMPHAVKDLADARGLPTTSGFHHPDEVGPATVDSPHVAAVRAAGAVFVGKTNVPAFGLGSHTRNDVFGPTRNPYDLTRSAGGSSGGAAVALATRMVPVADGSDFFGSLRNPAGWNCVLGFRPTLGLLADGPTDAFTARAATNGPMARTATDLARLLDVMVPGRGTADALEAGVTGTRIAWFGDLGGYLPTEPGVLEVCTAALGSFDDLGAHVDHVDALPTAEGFAGVDDLWRTWLPLRHSLVGAALAPLHADPVLGRRLSAAAVYEIEGLTRGADGNPPLTVLDVAAGAERRAAMVTAFQEFFTRYEFAVLPTAQLFPFPVDQPWPTAIAGREMSAYHRWMEVTSVATLLGCPAVALPAGLDDRGLPMGIQVLARHGADHRLLQLARAWENADDRVERLRPVLTGG